MSDNLPKRMNDSKLAQWYKSGQSRAREYAMAREILKQGVQMGRRLADWEWQDLTRIVAGVNAEAVWPIIQKTLEQHGMLRSAQWEGGPDEDIDLFFTDDEVVDPRDQISGVPGIPVDVSDPGMMPSDAPFDPGELDDINITDGVVKAPPSFDAEDVERAMARLRKRRAHKVWDIKDGPGGAQLARKVNEDTDRERTDPMLLGRTASTYIGGVEFIGKVTKVASDGLLELTTNDGNTLANIDPEFCDFFRVG